LQQFRKLSGRDDARTNMPDESRTRIARWTFCITAAALLLAAAIARADESPRGQTWLIDTRCLERCDAAAESLQSFGFRRMDDCRWTAAAAEDFFAAVADAPALPVVVFIHGNNTDAAEAVEKGLFVRRSIRAAACRDDFHFVIWSWPAERTCRRHRADAELKADRADDESRLLAVWLDRLPPRAKVSLIGHSFGPRIIAGALHLLAGGEFAGGKLPPETIAAWTEGNRNPIRAVLLAAAFDADSFAPGGEHSLALSLVEDAVVTRNCRDRILRWYTRTDCSAGEAMGLVGPRGVQDADNLRVLDVSCSVGRKHDWRCYCSAADVAAQWARYAFLEPAP
jgi:esterase/lipase superfamily enzyme